MIEIATSTKLKFETLERAFRNGDRADRIGALRCVNPDFIPIRFLEGRLWSHDEVIALWDLVEQMRIPAETILEWFSSSDSTKVEMAMRACALNTEIPNELIYENRKLCCCSNTAVRILASRGESLEKLMKMAPLFLPKINSVETAKVVMNHVAKNSSSIMNLVECFKSTSYEVLLWCVENDTTTFDTMKWDSEKQRYEQKKVFSEAIKVACDRRWDLTDEQVAEIIKRACPSFDATVCAPRCTGKDYINDCAYLKRKRLENEPKRTFEPPKTVFKRCLRGVIIEATIPETAYVQIDKSHSGVFSGEKFSGEPYRASEAVIIGVEGDFFGEEVGLSNRFANKLYRKGDTVTYYDYDRRNYLNNLSGFYFFTTKKEAKESFNVIN